MRAIIFEEFGQMPELRRLSDPALTSDGTRAGGPTASAGAIGQWPDGPTLT
ncbi:MAG: hypothetical protein R2854_15385 [Caldilineaceae bacterium]